MNHIKAVFLNYDYDSCPASTAPLPDQRIRPQRTAPSVGQSSNHKHFVTQNAQIPTESSLNLSICPQVM